MTAPVEFLNIVGQGSVNFFYGCSCKPQIYLKTLVDMLSYL